MNAATPGQAAYELPALDIHPDDLAEGWLAATYEPDESTAGVSYKHEDMLAIHRAGWDHARTLTAEALAAQERPAPAPDGMSDRPVRHAAEPCGLRFRLRLDSQPARAVGAQLPAPIRSAVRATAAHPNHPSHPNRRYHLNRKSKLALAAAAAAAVCVAAPVAAHAVTAPPAVHHAAYFGCFTHNGAGAATEVTGHPMTCPTGSILAEGDKGTQGPAGPAGPAGAPGKDGAPGTSGVVSVTTETGTAALPAIGGSWSAGHAAVKSFTLPAGTYLVTLTGDFYKTATTTATPVLQVQLNGASRQLTGYTGAFPYNAAEATGTGTDGTPNGLEQTAVAEGIVTVAAGAQLEADAFGYNPDRSGSGGGDFAVNVTVSAVQLSPAALWTSSAT